MQLRQHENDLLKEESGVETSPDARPLILSTTFSKNCGAVQTSSEEKESAFLSACSFPNSLLIRDGATDLCWVTNETHCKSSEQNNNIFAWACVYVWACTCGQVLNIVLHWTFKADLVPLWATCGLRCLCHSSCGQSTHTAPSSPPILPTEY